MEVFLHNQKPGLCNKVTYSSVITIKSLMQIQFWNTGKEVVLRLTVNVLGDTKSNKKKTGGKVGNLVVGY